MGWAYGVCITLCVLIMAEGSSHGGHKAICRPFNLWFCVLIKGAGASFGLKYH